MIILYDTITVKIFEREGRDMSKRNKLSILAVSVMLFQALVGRTVLGSDAESVNTNLETTTQEEHPQDFFEESRSEYEIPISEGDGTDLPPPPDPPSTVTTETTETTESPPPSVDETTSAETTLEITTVDETEEEETITETTVSQPTPPTRPPAPRINRPYQPRITVKGPREIIEDYLQVFVQTPDFINGLRDTFSVAYPIPDFLLIPINQLTLELLLIFINL